MKKLIAFVLLVSFKLLPAQNLQIVSVTVIPASPTTNDLIKVAVHVSAGYAGIKINQSYTVNLNTINLEACYFSSNVPVITQYLDTFAIGQLPAGTYSLNFKIHTSSVSHACNIIAGQDRDSSRVFSVSAATGIPKKQETDFVRISPNPVKDKLVLSYIGTVQNLKFKIQNSMGQVVYQEALLEAGKEIDMSGFANGVYFISIQTDSGQKIYRVVKE